MTEQEMFNWLSFGLVVAWFCKIGFHFVYLKSADERIREMNFVSFYLNIKNFPTSVMIIAPMFISRTRDEGQEIKKIKRRARISTYVLWTMFAVNITYLLNHPQD